MSIDARPNSEEGRLVAGLQDRARARGKVEVAGGRLNGVPVLRGRASS